MTQRSKDSLPVDDEPIVAHEALDAGSREQITAAIWPLLRRRAEDEVLDALEAVLRDKVRDPRPPWPTGQELLALPSVEAAQRRKWEIGRARKGEAWVGEPPIVEAYPEQIDTLNYLDEHERLHGPDERIDVARALTRTVAEIVREIALEVAPSETSTSPNTN